MRVGLQPPGITREEFVHDLTDQQDDVDIGPFVAAADVVALPFPALLQNRGDAPAMVFHIKPVANLATIAVEWQGLVMQDGQTVLGVWLINPLKNGYAR